MLCGSAFAPVIEYVMNLIYQLMKAIQSLVYAFSGINIFAKATASSMSSTASSAKKASKSLSSVHSEINNVSSNDDSSGSGSVSPSMDLTSVDSQMNSLSQKLYDFFKPLVESWNKYGNTVIEGTKNAISGIFASVSAMWESVETIITNGTIYSILANILNSIGAIGQAWANAWKNDNNGTEIIQSFAKVIDNITQAILNLVKSTGFQKFLNGILTAISGIVQFLEPLISGFSEMAGIILEIVMSTIGDLLTTIGNALQSIAQNEVAAEVLKAIGAAIAIIVGAILLWNAAQLILNGLMTIFAVVTSPITLIILAIVAAITAIILIIKNWGAISEWFGELWTSITDTLKDVWNSVKEFFINCWQSICDTAKNIWNAIKEFLANIWEGIKNIATTVWTAISNFFSNIWNGIKNVATNIWNGIKTTISNVINGIRNIINNVLNTIRTIWNNIWNGIKDVVSNVWNGITNTIGNVINGIKDTISNILNTISNTWNNIWEGMKNTVTNIFDSIWNAIRNVINSILGGIEGMANGVINGINAIIRVLNNLSFEIPDWVPVFGGRRFGFNIPRLSQISLPRLEKLEKGAVLKVPTVAEMAEYPGARQNPEIVTPQNIMEETFDRVLARYQDNDNSQPIYLTVNVGNEKLGQILLNYLRSKKRQTGKNLEALVG